MKKGVLKLAIIVIGLNLIFLYIGLEFLPQSESRPPKVIKVAVIRKASSRAAAKVTKASGKKR